VLRGSQAGPGHHRCKEAARVALVPFFSALRFRVAVIFKGLYGTSSATLSISFKRSLVSVSLYLVGDDFIMAIQSTHVGTISCIAHRELQSWSIKTGDVVDNASSDFLDVFKIVQSFSPGRITSSN
jgi:hypothetical protein